MRAFKALVKKRSGQGDLICSLVVILALTMVVLFFINASGDINTRIKMDQIARKYILRMESSGELTGPDKTACENELRAIPAVAKAIGKNGTLKVEYTTSTNGVVSTSKGKYGSEITLKIECPAMVVRYFASTTDSKGNERSTLFGIVSHDVQTFVIEKQSTAKY